jgi:tetratricopeptide (TPR) repeat protein
MTRDKTPSLNKVAQFMAICLVILLVMATQLKAEPLKVSKLDDTTHTDVQLVLTQLEARSCKEAQAPLLRLWDNKNLLTQDKAMFVAMRLERIICTAELEGLPAALALSELNLKSEFVTFKAYELHISLLLGADRAKEAVPLLFEALSRYPDQISQTSNVEALRTLLAAKDDNTSAFIELMDMFESSRFEPEDPRGRLVYSLLLVERWRLRLDGQAGKPVYGLRLNPLNNSYAYVLVMSDARLTVFHEPVKPSLKALIEQDIVESKIYLMRHPEDLDTVDYLTSLYEQIDQEQEVVSLLNRYLGLVEQNGLIPFENPLAYGALIVKRAGILANLGRHDEVIEAFKSGEVQLTGQNYADFYFGYMNYLTDMGREKEALALEAKLDLKSLTDYEKEGLAAQRACAYAYLKDTAAYEAQLKLLPAHGLIRMKPLVCASDAEAAAKNLIEMIQDKKTRDDAIIFVQQSPPLKAWNIRDEAFVKIYEAIKRRPDVLAAAKANSIIIRTWDARL